MAQTETEDMLEEGVGLIARALFRIGHKEHGNDPKQAFEEALRVCATVRSLGLDFAKQYNDS